MSQSGESRRFRRSLSPFQSLGYDALLRMWAYLMKNTHKMQPSQLAVLLVEEAVVLE